MSRKTYIFLQNILISAIPIITFYFLALKPLRQIITYESYPASHLDKRYLSSRYHLINCPFAKLESIGNLFYGSKGYMAINGYDSYRTWLGEEQAPGPSASRGGNNWANFIDCVRSRKKENLNARIEDAHISCTLLHLGNASYRLGRTLKFDPATQQVTGDDEANRLLRDANRGYRAPYVVPDKV